MYRFNIIITEICNANCSHCYMANDKKAKKTMTKSQIKRIIDNLPNNTDIVVFTGGEIFMVKDLLYYAIKNIKNKNSSIEINLESNGKYFYESTEPYNELKFLKAIGVDSIRFSDDPFHQDGGIDINKVISLKKYQTDETPIIKFLKQQTAVPIGKAEKLASKYKAKTNCMNTIKTVENPYFFIDVNGDANLCTWKCIPPIGNILRENFTDIEKRLEEEFYKLVLKGKIEEAISLYKGENITELKKISKENGMCYLCANSFGGNKK